MVNLIKKKFYQNIVNNKEENKWEKEKVAAK